jgi:alkylated DNA repair protein (DNA oxidative demethylase)
MMVALPRRDRFAADEQAKARSQTLTEGAMLLRGFAAALAPELVAAILDVAEVAPFRHMVTPGGYRMSVAMTNCGAAGWITDRRSYRYDVLDPLSGRPWPAMPDVFEDLAMRAAAIAGFPGFTPDACLVNRYEPGARLSLHQDIDEQDFTAPIVSVSLGLPATFLFGVSRRADRPRRIGLSNGDVVVWGGSARRVFHGVAPLKAGEHPLSGPYRFNLTVRKAF